MNTTLQSADTHFGFSGMSTPNYHEFLGLGKRARRRRNEKRAIRMERRKLKNDERRADTERSRAETAILTNTMMPEKTASGTTAKAQAPATSPSRETAPGDETQKAGFGGTVFIVAGVLILGGFLYMNKKPRAHHSHTLPQNG